jgi:hypothetical protein
MEWAKSAAAIPQTLEELNRPSPPDCVVLPMADWEVRSQFPAFHQGLLHNHAESISTCLSFFLDVKHNVFWLLQLLVTLNFTYVVAAK